MSKAPPQDCLRNAFDAYRSPLATATIRHLPYISNIIVALPVGMTTKQLFFDNGTVEQLLTPT
jgi:hypothetical protein